MTVSSLVSFFYQFKREKRSPEDILFSGAATEISILLLQGNKDESLTVQEYQRNTFLMDVHYFYVGQVRSILRSFRLCANIVLINETLRKEAIMEQVFHVCTRCKRSRLERYVIQRTVRSGKKVWRCRKKSVCSSKGRRIRAAAVLAKSNTNNSQGA